MTFQSTAKLEDGVKSEPRRLRRRKGELRLRISSDAAALKNPTPKHGPRILSAGCRTSASGGSAGPRLSSVSSAALLVPKSLLPGRTWSHPGARRHSAFVREPIETHQQNGSNTAGFCGSCRNSQTNSGCRESELGNERNFTLPCRGSLYFPPRAQRRSWEETRTWGCHHPSLPRLPNVRINVERARHRDHCRHTNSEPTMA